MLLDYKLGFLEPIDIASRLAKPFESCSLKSYWDPVGFPTNGWGNLLQRTTKSSFKIKLNMSNIEIDDWLSKTWPDISQQTADDDLHSNILKAYYGVLRNVNVKLHANQYAALTDFAFNLGVGNLQSSTLLKLINRGDFLEAADQFPKWNKAGGRILQGLVRRRYAERLLFLQNG